MAVGIVTVPGIPLGLDDMETAPAWVWIGFVSWLGTYVGPVNSPYGLFNGSYGYFNGSYGLLNGPYGLFNNFCGPAFGGRPWNNCGSVTLASIGGGSGGYLSLSSNQRCNRRR